MLRDISLLRRVTKALLPPQNYFISHMFQKKTLGQHFLRNRHYLAAIADAAGIQKGETVLEIGPGDGALTEQLLACSLSG